MQALAAEFSGFRRKTPLLFAEKNIKTVCFDSRAARPSPERGIQTRQQMPNPSKKPKGQDPKYAGKNKLEQSGRNPPLS
jgi:hypothetical protein